MNKKANKKNKNVLSQLTKAVNNKFMNTVITNSKVIF